VVAYGLYPVRRVVEGMGSIEPVFEDLIVITPDRSGMVTRVRVSSGQDVDRGTSLFEYLPDGQWAVLAYGSMTQPGGAAEPPPAEPEWVRTINQRRLARAEALRRWSARVFSHSERQLVWERLLEQRLNVRVAWEDDLALEEARAADNARLGRHEANMVRVFDHALGVYRGTEDGQPFASDIAGMVYSL
jgi:multidrug efflux pump subunit AcrA (membrane-fusion protein)